MNKYTLTIILLFNLLTVTYAQSFKLEAQLEKVSETNFYRIKLAPEIVSGMENFPHDVRIFDEQNNEVPYLFLSNKYHLPVETLKYEKFKNSSIKKNDNQLVIRIENLNSKLFSLFYIMYKNPQNRQNIVLYGGNEMNKMKVILINDKSFIHNSKGSSIEFVYFQPCSYKYFEIHIKKFGKKYANVSKVGYINHSVPDKSFIRLLSPKINQKLNKEQRVSQIKITYNYPQRIDLLKINIASPDFYYRDAHIQIKDSSFYKKKKNYYYRRIINSFKLNSDCASIVFLNNFREQTFYLEIENKDNLPLKIDSIECFQKKYYLIAKLENNKTYFLRCGDSRMTKAQYDIQYFTDKIPKHLKTIKTSETKPLNVNPIKQNRGFKPDKKVVWLVIIFISVILLYITVKMLKNTDN